jgi:DNA-directed RNA polymerase I subunit RPA34
MAKFKSSEYVNDSDSDSDAGEFQPPKNFSKIDKIDQFPGQLNNKEVWLIKVPKKFPVSKLSKLPVSFTSTSISNGPKSFELKHTKYQVNEELLNVEDNSNTKYNILVNQGKYKKLQAPISRFYNISQSIQIPDIDYEKVVIARTDVDKVTNLRMRHFPTGYGANDYDEAQAKEEEPPKKKQKLGEEKTVEKKEKKDKKDKKDKKEKKDKKDKKDKKERKEKIPKN